MPLSPEVSTELAHGTAYSFSEWPNSSVPRFGAGVYTIWHDDGRFIYVGMSGRGITADTIHISQRQAQPCSRHGRRQWISAIGDST